MCIAAWAPPPPRPAGRPGWSASTTTWCWTWRAARAAGATQFLVVSAVGASLRGPAFYSRVKGRMERSVAEAGYATVHILRPSLLLGARQESRLAEDIAQKLSPLLSPLFSGRLSQYRPVQAEEVAAAMLTLALRPATGVHIHHYPFLE